MVLNSPKFYGILNLSHINGINILTRIE